MNARETIIKIIGSRQHTPTHKTITTFAPVNIALIKYWGKRDNPLNLPVTNSLSIALPTKGTTTTIRINHTTHDAYWLNGEPVDKNSEFFNRLHHFCDLFRFHPSYHFDIDTKNNIPTAAGLASSASGFAALTLAFNQLFRLSLEKPQLSILARLGSGSACRSLWEGCVEWEKGQREDGLDSFAHPYEVTPSFLNSIGVGLLIFAKEKKKMSSRDAMLATVQTSPLYSQWPKQVEQDLTDIKIAISQHNFVRFGEIAEKNALAMHHTMLMSQPSINYCDASTHHYREKIWSLRKSKFPIYFTQDAGPNIKLLFQKENLSAVKEAFPEAEIVFLT